MNSYRVFPSMIQPRSTFPLSCTMPLPLPSQLGPDDLWPLPAAALPTPTPRSPAPILKPIHHEPNCRPGRSSSSHGHTPLPLIYPPTFQLGLYSGGLPLWSKLHISPFPPFEPSTLPITPSRIFLHTLLMAHYLSLSLTGPCFPLFASGNVPGFFP